MTASDDARADGAVVTLTERLVLRRWRDDDAAPFARINADRAVMRFLGGPMSRAESDALLGRLREQWNRQGYGRCAVEDRESGELLGFTGLGHHPVAPEAPEIGWRLASGWWRRGIATEAAESVRDLAFGPLGMERLVSVAVPGNVASLGVMRRIGMHLLDQRDLDGLRVVVWAMARGQGIGQDDAMPSTSRTARTPLDRVRATCLDLPEVSERPSHGAPSFFVREKKTFVMFMDDHHGDGRLALWCAAPPGAQEEMVGQDPDRFFRPPYVGHRGWLGVRVDGGPDWAEVRAVIEEAYRTVAPKSLVTQLDTR